MSVGESEQVENGILARAELLEATDAQIDDALSYADPMGLRGLLYQLLGDEAVAATQVTEDRVPEPTVLKDPAEAAFLRAKAAEFLKGYRDDGAGPLHIGPATRLPRSLALTAGVEEIPENDLEIWQEVLALDPWARGIDWKYEAPSDGISGFSVVVVGAGMGGLNAAADLKRVGIDFTVIEKNPAVGGTWFENNYPGARVDSPSRTYTHIFGVDFIFSHPFCGRDENQRYFNWVADNFGLREHVVFDTEVVSMIWDEATATWEVNTKGPEGQRVWRANVVISAVGLLSRPKLPQIEGMSDFEGPSFHTARWPDDFDPTDKRMAVIGTGCSGVQLVPELALRTGHVSVFQRTPQWLFDHKGYLHPFPAQVTWLDRNFPYYTHFMRFRTNWLIGPHIAGPLRQVDPTFDDPYTLNPVNKRVREDRIAFIRAKFANRPDLAEKTIPPHPPFSTRPVQVDSDYCFYDALLRDNVRLITDRIDRITAEGIRTQDGTDHQVDAIVYATGFRASECLWPMEVRGRDDRSVEDLWAKDGPRAYVGAMVPGFPNFFMLYGPNMNPNGGLGVVDNEEMVTRLALQWMQHLIVNGKKSVEVTEEAYWRWNSELDERERWKIYMDSRANSYYKNEHGRSVTNCPFLATELWHRLRTPNFDDSIVG